MTHKGLPQLKESRENLRSILDTVDLTPDARARFERLMAELDEQITATKKAELGQPFS